MNINRMKDIFKKEDAAGLVLALMVLVVLAVLGIAVAGVTIGSHKLGDIGRDSSSAYYIAEAGANLAYEKIKSGVMPAYTNSNNETIYFTNVADLITAFNPEVYAEESFEIQFGDQPKATVTISGPEDHDDGKLYTIESVGEIGGKSRTVEKPFLVKYVEIIADGETMPFLPPSAALIVKGKVEMGNSSIINGDVYTDSQTKGSFELKNSAKVTGYIYSSYKGKLEDIVALGNSASYGGLAVPDAQILWPAYESMLDMIKMPENEESYTNIGSINLANSKSETIEINENVILTNISLSNSSKLLINANRCQAPKLLSYLILIGARHLSY